MSSADPLLRRRRRSSPAAVVIAATLSLAACATGPRTVEVLAQGAAKLNPTFDGQPSAVNVRLFPLVAKEAFENATDQDLQADPPKLETTSWVAPHKEAVVYVGQRNWVPLELQPQVRFVGVLGLFNESTGTHRVVVEASKLASEKLVFEQFSIGLQPRAAEDRK